MEQDKLLHTYTHTHKHEYAQRVQRRWSSYINKTKTAFYWGKKRKKLLQIKITKIKSEDSLRDRNKQKNRWKIRGKNKTNKGSTQKVQNPESYNRDNGEEENLKERIQKMS